MQRVKNLILIGTSHIAQQSVDEVKTAILTHKPKVIAVELDKKRLIALLHPQQRKIHLSDIRKVGLKGFLFNLLGAWAEKKLGKMVGLAPGSEMKAAITLAEETGALVALIDQDIHITLKKLSKEMKFSEKFRLTKEILLSMILPRKKIKIDLRKVPSEKLIAKLTQHMKKKYPSIYRILVEERNVFMAKALYKIMNEYKEEKVVAIVGAGHEKEIAQLLKKRENGEVLRS